jgi:osmotically-inducible protein OsmY
MTIQRGRAQSINRSDDTILAEIWQTVWKEETIRMIDFHDISMDAEKGQVCLSGHVSRDYNKERIEEIARSVHGVVAVHNHLVSDYDLNIQVAQALGNHDCTRPYMLPVHSYHGWVELGGVVPKRHIQSAAEEIAASVPAVRGVILLPEIEGENHMPVRHAVQPGIGVRVYGEDEIIGIVYQVVISPRNRLVTHAIVRVSQMNGELAEIYSYLVPVEAMKVVDEGGIILNHNTSAIQKFPIFNPEEYPFASITWQPPYPYAAGSVRWPRQENVEADQHIEAICMKAELDNDIHRV